MGFCRQVASLPAAAWAALPGPTERAAYLLRLLQLPLAPNSNPDPSQTSASAPPPAPSTPAAGEAPTSTAPNQAPLPSSNPIPNPSQLPVSAPPPPSALGVGGTALAGQPGGSPQDLAGAAALLGRLALGEASSGLSISGAPDSAGTGSALAFGEAGASGGGVGEWLSGGSEGGGAPGGYSWQDQALMERCGPSLVCVLGIRGKGGKAAPGFDANGAMRTWLAV